MIKKISGLTNEDESNRRRKTPIEITLEVNPDDLGADRLDSLIEAGINRFSIGIQVIIVLLARILSILNYRICSAFFKYLIIWFILGIE